MNTQVICRPMARAPSAATTEESTPPESARITRSSPTCSRISAAMLSTRLSIVHVASRPQISNRKFERICWPNSVCFTSGWNWVAYSLRSGHSMDATGHTGVEDVTVKPSGARLTASRWLIHTVCSMGVALNSALSWSRSMVAGPYSPISKCETSPPSVAAMIWWP